MGDIPAGTPAEARQLRPNQLQAASAALTTRDWITAILTGVAAYVVAYIVAVVSLLLTTAFTVAGSGASTSSGTGSLGGAESSGLPTVSDLVTAVTVIFGAPAQLVALADLGRLSIHGSVTVLTSVSGSIHIGIVPVLVALVQIAAVVVGVRLFRARRLDIVQSAVVSVVTGASLAIVTLLVGLVLAIRLPSSTDASIAGITAVTALAVIVALVVGSVVAMVARPAWLTYLHPMASRLLGVVRVTAIHLGLVTVVVALVAIAIAAFTRPEGASALPLVLGNVAVVGAVFGFFGGVSLSGSADSLVSTLSGGTSSGSTITVFNAGSGWVWLLVLLVVVTAVAAGFALAVRRGTRTGLVGPARSNVDWVAAVVAYALAGVALLLLGTVVFTVQISALGGSGSAGTTPWTIAVLAAWGAAIEAVARYLAPRVVPIASPGVLRFTQRLVGADVVPASVAPVSPAPVLVDGVESPPAGAPEPVQPLSPRAKKILVRSLIAGGIAVVVIVGGSITAGTLRSTVFGPGHAAEAYLDAIRDGDATAAARLTGSKAAGSGLLSDAAFHAAKSRITDIAIGKATVSGDLATVAVSYRQGGSAKDATMRLNRTGTSWLVHDTWSVTSALVGSVSISTDDSLGDVDILAGGKKVGTTSDGALTLKAYPGTYSLSTAGTKYFAASTKNVTVVADSYSGGQVTFDAKATPQLETDAKKFVTDLIAKCAASTSGEIDDSCPFSGAGSDATNVSYKVTEQPTLSVSLGYDGTVMVEGDGGTVDTKYTDNFFGSSYDEDYPQSMYLYTRLKISGDSLALDSGD